MAVLRPFRALRPSAENAARVAAVPYDVVSTAEAREAARGNPLSFLHVSRAEIDLPEGTNLYGEEVYAKAAENFEKLKRSAPLEREDAERLYVYRLRMGDHEQTGVAGCASLEDYDENRIRKHERTRKDKEDDRTRHMLRLGAQTGPVLLAYRGRAEIDAAVDKAKQSAPLYDVTGADGVSHTIWRLGPDESQRLSEHFAKVPAFYIADGHHRAASADRARGEIAGRSDLATGREPYNFFIVVAFPEAQLRILPYNRVVKDLGATPQEFLASLKKKLSVTENAPPAPAHRGEVSIYVGGKWYGVTLPHPSGTGPIEALDADLLQRHILQPILSITDIRTDKRIDFVGGIRGTEELSRLVDSGKFAAAFSLFPVSLHELLAVSDAGEIMPPKSTWFEPKLRDGLLIHEI